MMKRAAKRFWLLPACYAGGLLLLLLWHLVGFVQNRMAYAAGDLVAAIPAPADFHLEGLAEDGAGRLISLTGDAQMLLLDTTRRVETVTVRLRHSRNPVAQSAYWAAPGQAYSVNRMAWPDGDGVPVATALDGGRTWLTESLFLLPAAGGQALRIDPCSVAGDIIEIESIIINEQRPFFAFFIFSAGECLLLCVLPGLAACGASVARDMLPKRARRKTAKAGDAS